MCHEVSLGTWEHDPLLHHFFLMGNDLLFCIAKSGYRTGSGPHVPSETSRHRPPTRTGLKLCREDSTFSGVYALQVWSRSVPCEARTRGGSRVLCAKSTFLPCPGWLRNRTREARALCGFQHHKGENLFCFLFSNPIIVGLP